MFFSCWGVKTYSYTPSNCWGGWSWHTSCKPVVHPQPCKPTPAVVLPVADDDTFSFIKTSGATDITSSLLAGDTGTDGTTSTGLRISAATITGVETNTDGIDASDFTVVVGADGKVTVVTAGDFVNLNNGEDIDFTLQYTVTDANGRTDIGIATITVTTDEG